MTEFIVILGIATIIAVFYIAMRISRERGDL